MAAPSLNAAHLTVTRLDQSGAVAGTDDVADEAPLEIQVAEHDGPLRPVAVVLRTRDDDATVDEELALGFLFTEGVIRGAADVARIGHCTTAPTPEAEGNVMQVRLAAGVVVDWERLRRNTFSSSSCGVCGKATIDAITATLPTTRARPMPVRTAAGLNALCETLRQHQPLFIQSGAVHGALVVDDTDAVVVVREDVGRHNAVDKVIGHLLRSQRETSGVTLVLSGRIAFEIVQKAIVAGLGGVVAIGAPTALAVELAARARLPLVGFVKDGRATVYVDVTDHP